MVLARRPSSREAPWQSAPLCLKEEERTQSKHSLTLQRGSKSTFGSQLLPSWSAASGANHITLIQGARLRLPQLRRTAGGYIQLWGPVSHPAPLACSDSLLVRKPSSSPSYPCPSLILSPDYYLACPCPFFFLEVNTQRPGFLELSLDFAEAKPQQAQTWFLYFLPPVATGLGQPL